MENPRCPECDEELILDDFERICSGDDFEDRFCWGRCPKCDAIYEWEEHFQRVKIMSFEKSEN